MRRTTHQSNSGLLLSHGRCSDELRTLAENHGWPILEGVDPIRGIHACVAIEPKRVCVEYTEPIRTAPDLIQRLAALQSIDHVACYVPCVSPALEQSLASLGAQALTSASDLSSWMDLREQAFTECTAQGPERPSPSQRPSPRIQRVSRRIHKMSKGME